MRPPFCPSGVVKAQFLGKNQDYRAVFHKMQHFTQNRTAHTPDEIWFLEHEDVFTSGIRFSSNDILKKDLPVIKTNRGGAVTFHGKGQLVVYFLLDLKRLKLKPKCFIHALEKSVVDFLNVKKILAFTKEKVPGVYVGEYKIASIGLKIEHFYTYHGLSLNGKMALENFDCILPCGFKQKMVDLNYFNISYDYKKTSLELIPFLAKHLNVEIQ